ncbi:hypothetical protein SAMN05444000_12530 [Shimia gijangensis]|uniref:Outer membrane protein beta-barrel domain-containing protein n=1 Tax=Shimia gijangensis TaxID=1470563 RepID=A0A1M6RG85_9RHOB|nr:hypothetical protein [Shimia gijangensis]SHK31479.1 hypothetical protein SAMN05444000_12530 [Shimia gijangensis]
MSKTLQLVLIGLVLVSSARAEGQEKLSDDPTKIITKLGVRYTDYASVSGSIAFGPVTKINVSISENEDWTLGGSYLFNFGIVNFAASRKALTGGTRQTQYSLGSFVPLSAIGLQPSGWQLFPAFGINYTEGQKADIVQNLDEFALAATSSKGGYIGVLALKPITADWTFKTAFVGSRGSSNYSGFSVGAGLTYGFTQKDSISVFASYIDNTYGQRDQVGIGYKREF